MLAGIESHALERGTLILQGALLTESFAATRYRSSKISVRDLGTSRLWDVLFFDCFILRAFLSSGGILTLVRESMPGQLIA